MSEDLDNIGLLLNFEDKSLEARWRRHINAHCVDLDLIWTAGIMAMGLKVALYHWDLIKDFSYILPWTLAGHSFYAFILFLQCLRRDLYIAWRVPLTLVLKAIRDLTAFYYARRVATALWPPLAPAGSTLCRFFPGKMATIYAMTSMFTMCAPLKVQLPTFLAAIVTSLSTVPERCTLLIKTLWVFNIVDAGAVSAPMVPIEDPWMACVRTQSMYLIIFGAMAPLMVFSSLEEHWRLNWHAPTGRALLSAAPWIRAAHDAALFLFGCTIVRQCTSLVFFFLK